MVLLVEIVRYRLIWYRKLLIAVEAARDMKYEDPLRRRHQKTVDVRKNAGGERPVIYFRSWASSLKNIQVTPIQTAATLTGGIVITWTFAVLGTHGCNLKLAGATGIPWIKVWGFSYMASFMVCGIC